MAIHSKSKFSIRKPAMYDLPPLAVLFETYQHQFLDDFHMVDVSFIRAVIEHPKTWVFDFYGYCCGVVWLTDEVEKLHITLHGLIHPRYLKGILQAGLMQQIIDLIFKEGNFLKIKALCLTSQTVAMKLLKRLGFRKNGYFINETVKLGKSVDVVSFELQQKYWEKFNHGLWQKETNNASK